ncbi:DinB family protein, partial [Streptomyces sp. UMAF16]|nr:DinB family protein [Streptomyces sp. UMAF16]
MNSVIQNIVNIRKYLIEMCEPLSVVQLNTIPNGFNNNIIWNFGHLIAAQQGLCYIRSGLKPVVDE